MQSLFPLLNAFLLFVLPIFMGACKLPIDTMLPTAAQAGDLTIISTCDAMASRGGDICRVKEGQDIGGGWKLLLPMKGAVVGGEVYIYGKGGLSKGYAITEKVVEIPWKELFGEGEWTTDLGQSLLAKGEVRWKDDQGLEQKTDILGQAILLVLKRGYEPLPIDSGLEAFKGKCSFEYGYTTAGRSAVSPLECK